MTTRFARPLVKLAVIVGLAASLGACQTMADIDPTGLLADDAVPPPTDNASTPDLANVPGAPPTATPDDQKEVASSLAADGARTQYSADALRAGTEPAAPPPGAASPVSAQALAPASDAPPSAAAASPPPSAAAAASEAPPSAAPVATAENAPPSAEAPAAQPAAAAPPPPVPVTNAPVAAAAPEAPAPAAAPANEPERMAALAPPEKSASAPPPGAEPAVPAVPPAGAIRAGQMATPAMSDAALGFAPSAAPPLDPSVRNFVPAPILSHYRRTASLAGTSSATGAMPAEHGTAIASLGARPGAVADAVAAMNGGVMPTAIIYFSGDGTGLNAAARAQVRSAVAAFKAGGGEGSVRVVGHASSRTPNMPVEKHLELIFDKSQKRANTVAQELIHEGVPAAKVTIQAVGDSQPVYYESMPKGEDGNRRAEIFVQG